jgi:hypothetical protein
VETPQYSVPASASMIFRGTRRSTHFQKAWPGIAMGCLLLAVGSVPTNASPGMTKNPTTILACPSNTSDYQHFDTNTSWAWGGDVYTASGQVKVTIGFNSGSAAAYIRLVNIDTYAATSEVYFDGGHNVYTFTGLGCGHWQTQVKSASVFVWTTGSASSQGL